MVAEAAQQATPEAARLAALPAALIARRTFGIRQPGPDSASAILRTSPRHQWGNP